jgi:glycosyltransferase involved in cell wall biosynthesis
MPAPLRVLELLVSTELGGGPAHVRDLVTLLPPDEFQVTVGAPAGGPYTQVFSSSGSGFVDLPCDRLVPGLVRLVTREIRDHGIQIVHSHGKGAGVYGRLAARRAGIAAVHTFHGIHFRGYPIGLRSGYLALERWLAGTTQAIIHVSESQAREADHLGLAPRGRSHVIVNGIDIERLERLVSNAPISRRMLGVASEAFVVGTVARFDRVKGLDVLLDAFSRLAAALPRAVLVLIGDGPEAGRLRASAAERRIQDRVVFAGALPDAARGLPALDAFASASRGEGLPLGVLEAMACGLPVVATRVPGHVDAVDDRVTGVLVPSGAAAALADALLGLASDPARARTWGEAGRQRVHRLFSARRMTAEVAALYRQVGKTAVV